MSTHRLVALGVLAVVGFVAPADAQPAVERVTTPLDLKKCRHRPGKAVEDYGTWRCAGHGGMVVLVSGGDQRVTVSFGPNAAKEIAAGQTLAAFNSQDKTIEWRIDRRPDRKARAFATILRWSTTTLDDENDAKPIAGQVLVVTRLPPGGVCHVGYVDGRANPNANELAVEIADRHARSFQCGKDKPIILGVQGKGFSGPYSSE
jgi:hypothetical protein